MVKKTGGGRAVFAFYSLCQGLWGNSPDVNTISNGIDPQDSSFQEQESVAPFSSTVIDETGFESHRYGNNSNENDNIDEANDEVNRERSGEGQQNSEREKVKSFLRNRKYQKLCTRMGAETQMLHFVKEDMNVKRKLGEQLGKSDAAFNKNIAKVSRTMEVIGNAMQQCVGILGNLAQSSNQYNNFQSFNHHNVLLNLQNQGHYYKESVNQNGPY